MAVAVRRMKTCTYMALCIVLLYHKLIASFQNLSYPFPLSRLSTLLTSTDPERSHIALTALLVVRTERRSRHSPWLQKVRTARLRRPVFYRALPDLRGPPLDSFDKQKTGSQRRLSGLCAFRQT
ncbi:hypothetical protein H4582DRAFT_107923 [Lactarius indigo]|nr:hypothetical protein H4582DRAFT_107923 [Lactarius indigo]